MASIGISDVVTASVYSEKTLLKKLMKIIIIIIIIITNKSQETNVFSRAPEIDFRYETKARKVMIDSNLMLYSYVSIEILLSRGSKKVHRKFVLVGGAVSAILAVPFG